MIINVVKTAIMAVLVNFLKNVAKNIVLFVH